MDVKEVLLPIVLRWLELGECLRLKTGDLEGIQCEDLSPERSLTEMLKLWLRKVLYYLSADRYFHYAFTIFPRREKVGSKQGTGIRK